MVLVVCCPHVRMAGGSVAQVCVQQWALVLVVLLPECELVLKKIPLPCTVRLTELVT